MKAPLRRLPLVWRPLSTRIQPQGLPALRSFSGNRVDPFSEAPLKTHALTIKAECGPELNGRLAHMDRPKGIGRLAGGGSGPAIGENLAQGVEEDLRSNISSDAANLAAAFDDEHRWDGVNRALKG